MLTGILLAASFFVVAIQLPGKAFWVPQIWILDLVTSVVLVQILFSVRSNAIAEATIIAAITFTVLIHIWARLWRKIYL